MITSLARSAALLCLTLPAIATAAEFRGLFGAWNYDIAGTARDRGTTYDFQRDLELRTGGKKSLLLEWDTPPGWWPDLALGATELGADGSHTESIQLLPPLPPQERTITARADFDDYELTARYPWDLGTVRISGGMTLRKLSGTLDIEDSDQAEPSHQDYDELFPQLHAQLRWSLGTGLALVGTANAIEYDGSSATEWRAALEVRFLAPLFVELAYQAKSYQINVGDYAFDSDIDGSLLRGGLLFR